MGERVMGKERISRDGATGEERGLLAKLPREEKEEEAAEEEDEEDEEDGSEHGEDREESF